MSKRVLHLCTPVYVPVEPATTSAGVWMVPGEASHVHEAVVNFGVNMRTLVGLRPLCGAAIRDPSRSQRKTDGRLCKKCAKLDNRKKDRGFAARGPQ